MVADAIKLMLFPALMAFAASSDLLTMTISNRVSLVLAGGFFALAVFGGMSTTEILLHVGAGGVVLLLGFGFFARGWIGGGDAKLAAATALWLGFEHLLPYVIYASVFGGALTLVLLQFRLAPLPIWLASEDWVQRLHRKEGGVPYGIALAAAALAIYPDTPARSAGLSRADPRNLKANVPSQSVDSCFAPQIELPIINLVWIRRINHVLTFRC
jgi:prepilin peptidase CpaA